MTSFRLCLLSALVFIGADFIGYYLYLGSVQDLEVMFEPMFLVSFLLLFLSGFIFLVMSYRGFREQPKKMGILAGLICLSLILFGFMGEPKTPLIDKLLPAFGEFLYSWTPDGIEDGLRALGKERSLSDFELYPDLILSDEDLRTGFIPNGNFLDVKTWYEEKMQAEGFSFSGAMDGSDEGEGGRYYYVNLVSEEMILVLQIQEVESGIEVRFP